MSAGTEGMVAQLPQRTDLQQASELHVALEQVESLDDRPLQEHVPAFERAHELLQQRLGEADN
ncbi:MAG: hypothetical protein ACK5H2_11220 [Beutenbergiaceae bacterium]